MPGKSPAPQQTTTQPPATDASNQSSSQVNTSNAQAQTQLHDRTAGVDVQATGLADAHGTTDAQKARVAPTSVQDPTSHPYFPVFRGRVLELFAKVPAPEGKNPLGIATEVWTGVCQAMVQAAGPMADPSTYVNYDKGWVDMSSSLFAKALAPFEQIIATMASYSGSQFDRAQSFGFWSKPEGRTLGESICDLTLETSGIGAIFDDIPTLDAGRNGWDPQLWGALSKGYATAVAKQASTGNKRVHVCMGGGVGKDNIWGSVESKAMEKGLQGTGLDLADVATFHAVPAVSKKDRSPDLTKSGGDFRGTLYSGDWDTAMQVTNDYWNSLPDVA